MAASQILTIDQGAVYAQQLLWQDSGGTAINLTGYTATFWILTSPIASTYLFRMTSPTVAGLGITLGGSAGTVLLNIPGATTATLATGTFFYRVELVDSSSVPYRLIEGSMIVAKRGAT